MNWKKYFYFQKGDKTAIILLLILIVLSGGIYIITRPVKTNAIAETNSELEKEFAAFEAELKDKAEKQLATQTSDYTEKATYTKYPYQEKLKAGETIELNSADTSALKKIPKIGSGYANRIVKYREALGGYISMEQLKEVWGMDDYLYSDIAPYITLQPKAKKLNINNAEFKALNNHPYISYKQAQVIVDIRERKGNIESINRLSLLDEFTEKDLARLKPYLSFD